METRKEAGLAERSPARASLSTWLIRVIVGALGIGMMAWGATAVYSPDSYSSLALMLSDPDAAAYKFRATMMVLGLWCLLVALVPPFLVGERLFVGGSSLHARLARFRPWSIVVLLTVIYIAAYSYFTINRHYEFNSCAHDLGIMDQVVWNTAQGRPFASSFEVSNRFADHVQPLLALLAPLYWIYPRVEVLLVVQTVILALGALPTFWLARYYLKDVVAGWIFAALYLAYPALGFFNRFDFHGEAIVVPLLLLCFVAIARRKTTLMSLTLFLILLGKEEMGLTVSFVGLYLFFFVKGYRKSGAFWAVAGAAYSFLAMFIVIPYFRNAPSDTLVRYTWLGNTPLQMIGTLLTRPLYVIQRVPLPSLLWYLLQMTMPLAFAPFLSPQTLLLVLPSLLYNFLSSNEAQHEIYLIYTAIQIPVFFISGILGTRWLIERGIAERVVALLFPGLKARVAPLPLVLFPMIVFTVSSFVIVNPFTEQIREPFWLFRLDNAQSVRRAIALIPPEGSVLAAQAYVPHLSHRQMIQMYPAVGLNGQDFFLINLHDSRYVHIQPPSWHSQQFLWAAQHNYGILFSENGVYLLKKGGGSPLTDRVLYEMRQEAERWGTIGQ
jgi:uncharacterized membrane protein